MFKTKSNCSYMSVSKNNFNGNRTHSNFYSASKINDKKYRGFSAINALKIKSSGYDLSNQSPKISSGKTRNDFFKQRTLFSLLDINDKRTNAKGTSLPLQYMRRTEDEVRQFLTINFKPMTIEEYHQKQIRTPVIVKPTTPRIASFNSKSDDKTEIVTNSPNEEEKSQQLLNKQLSDRPSINENTKDPDYNEPIEKPRAMTTNPNNNPRKSFPKQHVSIISIDNPYKKKDKWQPEGYTIYENLVKNPKLMKQEVLLNTFARKLPNISIKEIREKSYNSDIFFTQPKEESYYEKAKCYTDHQRSDIFLQKDDDYSKSKSGERNMIVKDNRLETYTVSKKSNSEWHAKNSMPTLLNHNSTDWNLTNPDIKGIGKTKSAIGLECNEKDDKYNPIYRQKSLCEFMDLTRNGAPNPNRSYLACLNKTQNCFNRRSDVCATYNDIHREYKDLCDKPFIKPKLI